MNTNISEIHVLTGGTRLVHAVVESFGLRTSRQAGRRRYTYTGRLYCFTVNGISSPLASTKPLMLSVYTSNLDCAFCPQNIFTDVLHPTVDWTIMNHSSTTSSEFLPEVKRRKWPITYIIGPSFCLPRPVHRNVSVDRCHGKSENRNAWTNPFVVASGKFV